MNGHGCTVTLFGQVIFFEKELRNKINSNIIQKIANLFAYNQQSHSKLQDIRPLRHSPNICFRVTWLIAWEKKRLQKKGHALQ